MKTPCPHFAANALQIAMTSQTSGQSSALRKLNVAILVVSGTVGAVQTPPFRAAFCLFSFSLPASSGVG